MGHFGDDQKVDAFVLETKPVSGSKTESLVILTDTNRNKNYRPHSVGSLRT